MLKMSAAVPVPGAGNCHGTEQDDCESETPDRGVCCVSGAGRLYGAFGNLFIAASIQRQLAVAAVGCRQLRHALLEALDARPRRYVHARDLEYQRPLVVPRRDVRRRASASGSSDAR